MLIIATLENERQKDIMMDSIRYARKEYGYFAQGWRGGFVEDADKLALTVEMEKEDGTREIVVDWDGRREITMEKYALHIDAVNFLLNTPLVQTLVRKNRFRIHVSDSV